MKIRLNKREIIFPDNTPLITILGPNWKKRYAAVWINGEPILEEDYEDIVIHDGDIIKAARITGEYDLVYRLYGKEHFGMKHREG